jgi:hypothetical protein
MAWALRSLLIYSIFAGILVAAQGCIILPVPRVNMLPTKSLTQIEVIDAETGQPIPSARLWSVVARHDDQDGFVYRTAGGRAGLTWNDPYMGAPSWADARLRRYRRGRDGVYTIGRRPYFSCGYFFDAMFFLWETGTAWKAAGVAVDAPGYDGVVVGQYVKQPPEFEVLLLKSVKPFDVYSRGAYYFNPTAATKPAERKYALIEPRRDRLVIRLKRRQVPETTLPATRGSRGQLEQSKE